MGKIINKRYQAEFNNPEWNGFEVVAAIDKRSPDEELVWIYTFKRKQADDLLHSIVLRRAETLAHYNHPMIAPLLDYGYDQAQGVYFFVYQPPSGMRLDKYLQVMKPSLDWRFNFLHTVAGLLADLHSRGIAYGPLALMDIYVPMGDVAAPSPVFSRVGLANIASLLCAQTTSEENNGFEYQAKQDLESFFTFLACLISEKSNPVLADTEPSLRSSSTELFELLKPILSERNDKKRPETIGEIKRLMEQAQRILEGKDSYYVSITNSVRTQLYEIGFISHNTEHLALEVLNKEFEREVYGWRTERENEGEVSYRLTTSQFRLRCVPDNRTNPSTHFVLIGVTPIDSTEASGDREQGYLVKSRLIARPLQNIPKGSNILPLVERIDMHVGAYIKSREMQVEHKGNLARWEAVLEEQRRLLHSFRLKYIDKKYNIADSTIEVTIADLPENFNLEELDLTEEDLLRLTHLDGSQQRAGYFDGIQEGKLTIGLAANVDPESFKESGVITMDNEQVESVLRRQSKAIKRLRFGETVNPRLPLILTQTKDIDLKVDHPLEFNLWFQPNLDNSQKEAVRLAASSRDIFLVHGPPGAGKTSMIAELVLQIIEQDPQAKILITSQSNVAVNHALNRIRELRPDLEHEIVRVGREEKAGTAVDLLTDRQLVKWGKEVINRSEKYITEWRSKITGDSELTNILGLIEESVRILDQVDDLKKELNLAQSKLAKIDAEYNKLDQQLEYSRRLRQKADTVLAKIPAGDDRLRQIIQDFDHYFLNWASAFLTQIDQKSGLSESRIAAIQTIQFLETQLSYLEQQNADRFEKVNLYLKKKFNVTFSTTKEQHQFINSQFSNYNAEISRLARVERICNEWRQRVGKDRLGFSYAYLNQCKVIGATCIGIAAKGDVSEMEFDWVIVDEAGRATHPELLVPLVRGRKIVLVGDHRQLPPTLDKLITEAIEKAEGVRRSDFEKSLFEEIMENAPASIVASLNIQYRMHPAIGNLIGECFYNGKNHLKPGKSAYYRTHGLDWCPSPVIWFSTKRSPNNQEVRVGTSYRNEAEISLILKLLDRINQSYAQRVQREGKQHPLKNIGVIAGYLAQKSELRKRINQKRERWPFIEKIEVDTVDAFQGRECDIIIYSVVRNNPDSVIGFLRDERRLNVALSRAKDLLIIVGCEDVEFARVRGFNPFRTVIEYIRNNPKECRILEAVE